ncbi:MAG: AAA family ATPase [Cyanobacteria bacterium J06634_6]
MTQPSLSQFPSWKTLNQQYLQHSVQQFKEQLIQQITSKDSTGEIAPQSVAKLSWPREQPAPAWETLTQLFNLSEFEQGILLMCVAVELDPSFEQHYAQLQSAPPRPYPTLSLALKCFTSPNWNALTPAAPLRYWQLIEPVGDDSLITQRLRLDERILHYLMGITYLDPRIETFVTAVNTPTALPLSYQHLAKDIVQRWQTGGRSTTSSTINLHGGTSSSRETIVATACQQMGCRPYVLDVNTLPSEAAERAAFQRRWEREAALNNSMLLIDTEVIGESGSSDRPAPSSENRTLPTFFNAFLKRQQGRIILSSQDPIQLPSYRIHRIEVRSVAPNEQVTLWRQSLGPLAEPINHKLGAVVSQFALDPSGIVQVTERAKQEHSTELSGDRLWQLCRQQARLTLDDLAQRLEPVATWDDLVLPPPQKQTLAAIVASVRQRSQVHDDWGFSTKSHRGLGISALFAGSSGTGKTMSAEVLAQALKLDLYRIDLSAVVSKYIGETEKNLRRIFDAAEQGGVILLFDEADALFGKRSDVKDSHDRHANIEVSYLLQRMETYRGLAILTTNFKHALDSAFLRRIRFVVSFPFPDMSQREAMWQRIFPEQTPTEQLDASKLARLAVPGGNIYSIAMNAAFLASAEATPVRMQHLLSAAQSEYAKLDKKLAESEVRGWV